MHIYGANEGWFLFFLFLCAQVIILSAQYDFKVEDIDFNKVNVL